MSYHAGWLQNDPTPRRNPLAAKPKSKKRQKNVYKSHELPHLWVHKTQDSARNAHGNFYFTGDTIYSYGSHYPLAKHVTVNGQAAILINVSTANRGGSSTTNSQRYSVRRAIPSDVTVFEVDSLRSRYSDEINHEQNIYAYQYEAKTQLGKARNGRKYAGSALAGAFEQRTIATKYATFFGLPTPDFSFLPKGKELETLEAQIAERRARADAADLQREAKRDRERLERQRLAALEMPEKIAAWRAGSSVSFGWYQKPPTMLRIKGQEVQTSLGAAVPIEHAKRVLKIVRKVKERGEPFIASGHSIAIGLYKVDRIDADGMLTAGCHKIQFSEIELLGAQLDAIS